MYPTTGVLATRLSIEKAISVSHGSIDSLISLILFVGVKIKKIGRYLYLGKEMEGVSVPEWSSLCKDEECAA